MRKRFRTRMKGGGFTIIPKHEISCFLEAHAKKELTKSDVRLWAAAVLTATAKEGSCEEKSSSITLCRADYSDTISEETFGAVRRFSLNTARESVQKLKAHKTISGMHKRLRDARNLWGSGSIRVSRLVLRLAATGRLSSTEFCIMLLYFSRRVPDYKRLEPVQAYGVEFYGRITRRRLMSLTGACERSISGCMRSLESKGLLTSINTVGAAQCVRRLGYLLIDGQALADYAPVDNSKEERNFLQGEEQFLAPQDAILCTPMRSKRSEQLDPKKENLRAVPVGDWVSFVGTSASENALSFMKVSESAYRNPPNEMKGNGIQKGRLFNAPLEASEPVSGEFWKSPSLVDTRINAGFSGHPQANLREAA